MSMQSYNSGAAMPWQGNTNNKGIAIFFVVLIVIIIIALILMAVWNNRISVPPADDPGANGDGNIDDTHISSRIDTDISDGSVF